MHSYRTAKYTDRRGEPINTDELPDGVLDDGCDCGAALVSAWHQPWYGTTDDGATAMGEWMGECSDGHLLGHAEIILEGDYSGEGGDWWLS